jgi:glycosyltransferase involved in cell wall biosynthesis
VWSRASASLFTEYQEAPSPVRAWLVNNGFGRAIFLADRLFTPRFGRVDCPWWARAELVPEQRVVNVDRFSPDATPQSDLFGQAERRVLTVGRISRRKGTDRLLDVADRLPDHEFVVVGPVQDEALAAAVDDASNLAREPPVDYVEMPGLYTATDVGLSVSRLEWGGVSRAMLEGKAAGRCVVALDREEASSVADDVTSDDADEIAAAVRRCTD